MSRKHYTHLLPPSAELLASFLQANPDRYEQIDFDVHVGRGRDPGDQYEKNIRNMGIVLSQRRIDCVGMADDRIDIIEVTPEAGLTSLGQMLAYPQLYIQTYAPNLPVRPVLVTYQFSPDIQSLYRFHNIEFHIMPQPETSTSS